MLGDLCQQFKFVLAPAPTKVIANSPNHKYLLLLHFAYHRPAALQAAISHSGDGPRPLPYRALEPRGGIEPPHVHGVVHGRRFRFCYSTRHIKHHHKMMLCPAYIGHLWSHREESNLQPTDYKTVALPVELRWHIPPPLLSPRRNAAVNTAAGVVFFPLRLSRPSLGGDIMISHSQGSFQRDSAGSYRPTQASGFHGCERPNIAGGLSCTAWRSPCFWLLHIGGFRLYTLRRAQPLSMCRHTGAGHSCHRFRLHDRRTPLPFSGA